MAIGWRYYHFGSCCWIASRNLDNIQLKSVQSYFDWKTAISGKHLRCCSCCLSDLLEEVSLCYYCSRRGTKQPRLEGACY